MLRKARPLIFMQDLKRLVRHETPAHRLQLARDYVRIRFKTFIEGCGLPLDWSHERILGYSFDLARYSSFAYVFEEIFARRCYQVDLSNDSPVIIDGGANIGVAT